MNSIKAEIQELQQQVDYYNSRIDELDEQIDKTTCPYEAEYLENYKSVCQDSRARAEERIHYLKFNKSLKTEV